MSRPLYEIANEIQDAWFNVHYSAKLYLEAMMQMHDIKDNYMHDSGEGIVLRFLGNAKTWRGEHARRIKAELKGMLP